MRIRPAFCLALFVLGCGPRVQQLRDGSLQMECSTELTACTGKVGRFCQGRGYQVVNASEDRDTGKLASRVVFVCVGQDLPPLLRFLSPSPVAPSASAAEAPRPAAPKRPSRACVPGATQRCVGLGACPGGQACLSDGTGFGPCECATRVSDQADAGESGDAG
jgi:hypothetical protein